MKKQKEKSLPKAINLSFLLSDLSCIELAPIWKPHKKMLNIKAIDHCKDNFQQSQANASEAKNSFFSVPELEFRNQNFNYSFKEVN